MVGTRTSTYFRFCIALTDFHSCLYRLGPVEMRTRRGSLFHVSRSDEKLGR